MFTDKERIDFLQKRAYLVSFVNFSSGDGTETGKFTNIVLKEMPNHKDISLDRKSMRDAIDAAMLRVEE